MEQGTDVVKVIGDNNVAKDLTRRKRQFLATVFVRNFLSNMEYSVIIPSILLYIQSLGKGTVVTGVAVAMYPLGAMISLPINGYMYDKSRRIKELTLAMNLLQTIGSLVYVLPYSPVLPVVGRFVSGLGDGIVSDVTGEITYLYPGKERLTVMSLLELGRILGLMFGPVVHVLVKDVQLNVAGLKLDYLNLPGVVMAVLWCLMQLLTLCCLSNTARQLHATNNQHQNNNHANKNNNREHKEHNNTQNESTKLLNKSSYWRVIRESCLSREFAVLFYMEIVIWFIQVQFELLVPLLSTLEYKWTPVTTSLVYVAGGIEVIVIFVLIFVLSSRFPVHDAKLMMLACVLIQGALVLLIFEPVPREVTYRIGIYFTFCLLVFTTLPLNLVCSKNLITKMYPAKVQGIVQGIFSISSRISMISGPVVIGYVFPYRQVHSGVLSAFNVFGLIALMTCMKRIRKQEQITADEPDENT